jgi:hypothetical protein
MGQYPARDSWGGSQYARVVRNETEYWVEWVSSPGQDPYEEFITALRPAATPAAAVAVARQVLADIRNDIAQGKIYTNTALTRRKPTKGEYGMMYVRVSQPATVYDKSLYIGNYAEKSPLPATELRTIALRQYAEYERQINELPALGEEPRWMLLADMAPDTFFGDPTKDVITPQQLDEAYARNPALAKTLFLQICLQDEDRMHTFLMGYLEHHNGKATWLHEHIAQIPEVDTQDAWQRVSAMHKVGGDSWLLEFLEDEDVLRQAWKDIAAEQEEKKKRK